MPNKTRFLTRKKDKRVFPLSGKVARDSGEPSFVAVDPAQIERGDKGQIEVPKYKRVTDESNNYVGMFKKGKLYIDKNYRWGSKNFFISDKYGNAQKLTLSKSKIIRKDNPKPTSNNSKSNEISKSDYNAYEKVRASGVTNMFDVAKVEQLSGLPREKIFKIMEGYSKYQAQYQDSDKDGVPDKDDCEPYNAKKQGFIHDIAKKIEQVKKEREEKKGKQIEEDTKQQTKELAKLQKELSQRLAIEKVKKVKLDLTEQKREQLESIQREEQATKEKLKEFTFIGKLKKARKEKREKREEFLKSPEGIEHTKKVEERNIRLKKMGKKLVKQFLEDKPQRKSQKKKRKSKEGLGGLFE